MPGGEIKTVKAGEAFAEAVNVLHSGTNRGPATVRLVMFAIGVDSEPYAVRPSPEAPRKD
jgi:hypothetical protein